MGTVRKGVGLTLVVSYAPVLIRPEEVDDPREQHGRFNGLVGEEPRVVVRTVG